VAKQMVLTQNRIRKLCRTREHPTNGYPLKPNVARATEAMIGGLPGGDSQVWLRKTKIWHRLNVLADGSQNQFTFFNEPRAIGVTNLDQANTIPANYTFLCIAPRFNFYPGIDRGGFRVGVSGGAPTAAQLQASSMNFGTAAATITDNIAQIWKWQEKIRELMNQGEVVMTVAEKPVFTIWGLTSFPAGKGLVVNSGVTNTMTAAAASNSIQDAMTNVTNGVPQVQNAFSMGNKPYPIVAGQQFAMTVRLLRGVDFTETNLGPLNGVATTNAPNGVLVAGTLECELEGFMLSPAN
jgi:hypothetical protein